MLRTHVHDTRHRHLRQLQAVRGINPRTESRYDLLHLRRWPVGLRYHERHSVPSIEQSLERGHRETGATEENEPHHHRYTCVRSSLTLDRDTRPVERLDWAQ